MTRRLTITMLLILLFRAADVYAQLASDNHVVTVSVSPISAIQLTSAAVNLDITESNSVAGQDQMTVSDNSTQILWGTNSSAQKLTVMTDLAAPLFVLQVEATSATQGTPAGPVTVSTTPADLLLNIGRSRGTCTLVYTAIVLASQGLGTDTHLITITLQAQ